MFLRKSADPGESSGRFVILKPGESISKVIELTDRVQMSKLGSMRLTTRLSNGALGCVTNDIYFEEVSKLIAFDRCKQVTVSWEYSVHSVAMRAFQEWFGVEHRGLPFCRDSLQSNQLTVSLAKRPAAEGGAKRREQSGAQPAKGIGLMGQVAPGVMKCPERSRGEALELLYRKVPPGLREPLIVRVLAEAERGETDLSGLWIALAGPRRIAGAMLTQPLAGRIAALWPPEIRRAWRADRLAATMVQEAVADFAARGFKIVQSVVDESAGPQASRALEKGGIPRITEMLYLERATADPLEFGLMRTGRENQVERPAGASSIDADSTRGAFRWHSFDEIPELEFQRTLAATYTASLDMPELEGARSFEEILEGYKAVGSFAPERWMLGQVRDEPDARAVLLLAENQARKIWEVLYLGLTPAARGRGLGRAVVAHALELAREHVPWLELTVDVRNTTAQRLYESAGFIAFERRAVHLKVLASSAGGDLANSGGRGVP